MLVSPRFRNVALIQYIKYNNVVSPVKEIPPTKMHDLVKKYFIKFEFWTDIQLCNNPTFIGLCFGKMA